jgi:hypothetical protein
MPDRQRSGAAQSCMASELANSVHHPLRLIADLQHHLTGLVGQQHALLGALLATVHAIDRLQGQVMIEAHHIIDLHSGLTGTRRQVAYFIRHHGKATPLLAGTRRFDGRVESQ